VFCGPWKREKAKLTESITPDPAGVSRRPVAWDVSLSVALVITAAFAAGVTAGVLSLGAAGVGALGVPSVGTLTPVVIAAGVVAASILAPRVLHAWWNARRYSLAWLTLTALFGGATGALTGFALAPWPDLLSDEVAKRGEAAFLLEGIKTFLPWLAAVLAAFVTLRSAPVADHTNRG
jgi:hypothetical protein